MHLRQARLHCAGKEPALLQIRCAVLESAGYTTKSAVLPEAVDLLRNEKFDVVIVSAWLDEWEKGRILAAAGETPALVLTELTLARRLLAQVDQILQRLGYVRGRGLP